MPSTVPILGRHKCYKCEPAFVKFQTATNLYAFVKLQTASNLHAQLCYMLNSCRLAVSIILPVKSLQRVLGVAQMH